MKKPYFFKFLCLGLVFIMITACSGNQYAGQQWNVGQQNTVAQAPVDQSLAANNAPNQDILAPVKVALLVPLSGPNAGLGEAMMNASQLALFDMGYQGFELLPQDTKGTYEGGKIAAQNAMTQGAQLILGPVFSDAVKGAKESLGNAPVSVITFSTDWKVAGNNTFTMGFLPFDQIERVLGFASQQGIKTIATLTSDDEYGRAVFSAYQKAAGAFGIQTLASASYTPRNQSIESAVQSIIAQTAKTGMPQAIFMPAGGQNAINIASSLSRAGLTPDKVRRIGTGLMDDNQLAGNPNLAGAWFAGPAPNQRITFERKYAENFGGTPPRLASLAYDATALAAVLAQRGLKANGKPAFDKSAITNPNGFAGIDGIFRFRPNGAAERGLAVLEFQGGTITVVSQPAQSFQSVMN